jgi:hypothetical protein
MSFIGNRKLIGNGSTLIQFVIPFALNYDAQLMMYYTFEPSTYNATNRTFQNLGQSQYGAAKIIGNNVTVDSTNFLVGTSSVTSTGAAGNYVSLPNFTLTSTNLTVSFWIRRNGTGFSNEWPYIFLRGSYHGIQCPNGSNIFQYANFSTTIESNVITNTWYHIAFVYSNTATNKTVIYENGNSVYTSTTNLMTTGYANHHCLLGFNIGSDALNGNIDDFRMYGRDLSQSEIVKLYNYCS